MRNTYFVKVCRGSEGGDKCPFALFVSGEFPSRIENVIKESGWPAFIEEKMGNKIRSHQAIKVNAAACPNSCSGPYIADIGLIRACVPAFDHEQCIACNKCVQTCPDEALKLVDGRVVINRDNCLVCGQCIQACPVEAISCIRSGWRVLMGGRLGRHPKLGAELPGVYTSDEVLLLIDKVLKLYMEKYEYGKRFGLIFDKIGYEPLLKD